MPRGRKPAEQRELEQDEEDFLAGAEETQAYLPDQEPTTRQKLIGVKLAEEKRLAVVEGKKETYNVKADADIAGLTRTIETLEQVLAQMGGPAPVKSIASGGSGGSAGMTEA